MTIHSFPPESSSADGLNHTPHDGGESFTDNADDPAPEAGWTV